jgi:hypothetical protein
MGDISNINIKHLIDTDTIVKKDFHCLGGGIDLPQSIGSSDIDVTVYTKYSTIQARPPAPETRDNPLMKGRVS